MDQVVGIQPSLSFFCRRDFFSAGGILFGWREIDCCWREFVLGRREMCALLCEFAFDIDGESCLCQKTIFLTVPPKNIN